MIDNKKFDTFIEIEEAKMNLFNIFADIRDAINKRDKREISIYETDEFKAAERLSKRVELAKLLKESF